MPYHHHAPRSANSFAGRFLASSAGTTPPACPATEHVTNQTLANPNSLQSISVAITGRFLDELDKCHTTSVARWHLSDFLAFVRPARRNRVADYAAKVWLTKTD